MWLMSFLVWKSIQRILNLSLTKSWGFSFTGDCRWADTWYITVLLYTSFVDMQLMDTFGDTTGPLVTDVWQWAKMSESKKNSNKCSVCDLTQYFMYVYPWNSVLLAPSRATWTEWCPFELWWPKSDWYWITALCGTLHGQPVSWVSQFKFIHF